MLKMLSCLLSFTLIFTSVAPSLAQTPKGRTLRDLRRAKAKAQKQASRSSATTIENLPQTILDNARLSLTRLPHQNLFQGTRYNIPSAKQILEHQNPVEQKLLFRADFPVLALNGHVQPAELEQAVEFYRTQLTQAEGIFTQLPAADLTAPLALPRDVAGVVADIANLGMFGQAAKDAPAILETYQKTVGTSAEPVVTAVASRALLRLGAYKELEQMAQTSTLQPELWAGIEKYAQKHNLPVTIAKKERTAIDVSDFTATTLQDFGALSVTAVRQDAVSTALYMSAGNKGTAEVAKTSAKPAASAVAKTSSVTSAETISEGAVQDEAVASVQSEAIASAATPKVTPTPTTAELNLHAFRDQGLAAEGMEATYPVYWEDRSTGKTLDVTFQFEDQAAKEAFYKRVDLEPDEFFVFDRGSGGIVIRKELTAEQRAKQAKAKERGFFKIFFEGGQKTPLALYKVLFSREMLPSFEAATKSPEVMTLLSTYRADLKQILSKDLLAKYPALEKYLNAKNSVLDKATIELLETDQVVQISKDIAAELKDILAINEGTPIKVFKDDWGHLAQNITGMAEGTFGTMGQANTSALGLLGITKGFLSNLPTALGQFGPAWAPFIGAWAEKYGTKKMLSFGQLLGTGGHLTAATSLALGATEVLPPLTAFAGMVGGITINGVAGSFLKQLNPMIAKQRTSDPVSSSSTITDLNSWASVGGMYCYLFLPIVGALTTAIAGVPVGLGALSAMFGVAAGIPLAANLLLRKSRIENVTKPEHAKDGVFKTIGNNLKFGFKSPFLRKMFLATMGGHFMGLGFNSGPGHFIKENIADPSLAMAVSFASIYLTVFAGRKLGAKAMKNGFIGDKALAGLSALVGVSMGAASLLPGLDFVTRCGLFAAAGLGFSNWVNVLQSIELSRPENIGKEAAVSSMYILARTSGMLTMVMGAYGDMLGSAMGLPSSTAALYALTMPLVAGAASLAVNYKYITQDLWPTVKRWSISAKQWVKKKLGLGNKGNGDAPLQQEATAQ